MSHAFPVTRWSMIAKLPDQPQQVGILVGLYADAVGEFLHRKLIVEHQDRADDIVQEVLLDLLRKPEVLARAQPGAGSRFRYYLMHVAWLAALNALRRVRHHDLISLDAPADDVSESALIDQLTGTHPAPEQQSAMDRAWAMSVLQRAFDDLNQWVEQGALEAEALAILRANLVDGKALRDVAESLGLPLVTCHRRLAKARTMLQQAMVERLRLTGEIGSNDDPNQACDLLLHALA